MFIVWGTKRVTKRLGYVADFCPLCRDLRMFKVKRIGMAGHIYYITLSEGELAGHLRTCAVCDVDLDCAPERYKKLHDGKLPAPQLAQLTFPNWQQVWADRLAVEKEIRNPLAKFSPEDRRWLVREPFAVLSPRVEERFSHSEIDWPTLIALVGAILWLMLTGSIAGKFESVSGFFWALGWIGAIGAVGSQLWLIRDRFFRAQIIPRLVPALGPLKPTRAEIQATLDELKSHGAKIGRWLKADHVMAALAGPRPVTRAAPAAG